VSAEHARPSGTGHADAWRVILVGRTGLDQALRRAARVELIRARDSFDAVGELSDPIDTGSPARSAVLVAPDAEPDPGAGGADELGRFLDALRLVDPSARILRVGAMRPGYDGAIDPDADPQSLVSAIERTAPSPRIVVDPPQSEPAPESQGSTEAEPPTATDHPAPPDAPEPTPTAPTEAAWSDDDGLHDAVISGPVLPGVADARARPNDRAAPGDIDDEHALLIALGDGRPVLDLAMNRLRERAGRDDLTFEATPEPGMVPVSVRGHIFGAIAHDERAPLSARGRAALEPLAAWLGAWLRLESQQRELRLSAFTDELTGAWNRRYFHRFLESAIERSRSARRTVTLLYFDIDDFKTYNDAHGHDAGDEILVETVRMLNSVIRPSDRVCRVGGDEFAVIFYDPRAPRDPGSTPPESIYDIATRFQRQICAHRFPKLGAGAQGTLTISGGLASYPWDGADADTLLRVADDLSMRSKRRGKNAITLGQGAESVCRTPEGGNGQ